MMRTIDRAAKPYPLRPVLAAEADRRDDSSSSLQSPLSYQKDQAGEHKHPQR